MKPFFTAARMPFTLYDMMRIVNNLKI